MIRFLSVFLFAFKVAAKRDRRAIPTVDYAPLEAGLSPGLKGSNKSVKTASADNLLCNGTASLLLRVF